MKLFMLRHGHAEAEAPADDLRPLSAQGELEVHRVCQANYDELKSVELIYVSPYLRAQQTADIVAQYLTAERRDQPLIVPNGRPGKVIDFLYEVGERCASVLLVTHQPLVGTLVDELGGFETGRYRMGTANLACLECDPVARGCCTLQWLKRP